MRKFMSNGRIVELVEVIDDTIPLYKIRSVFNHPNYGITEGLTEFYEGELYDKAPTYFYDEDLLKKKNIHNDMILSIRSLNEEIQSLTKELGIIREKSLSIKKFQVDMSEFQQRDIWFFKGHHILPFGILNTRNYQSKQRKFEFKITVQQTKSPFYSVRIYDMFGDYKDYTLNDTELFYNEPTQKEIQENFNGLLAFYMNDIVMAYNFYKELMKLLEDKKYSYLLDNPDTKTFINYYESMRKERDIKIYKKRLQEFKDEIKKSGITLEDLTDGT